MNQPNILYVMTDQQRFDTIAALGNSHIYTPNLDRLVRRGASFTNAYTPCPVCVAARYIIRTGCLPPTTRCFSNGHAKPVAGQADSMTGRCGPYLAATMREQGYRTFGIGKFHTQPRDEDLGFDVHLHSEELYGSPEMRAWDSYASFIAREHPKFDYLEGLMGERTEMYYMPQMSAMPAELTVERWAADRAVEQIKGSGFGVQGSGKNAQSAWGGGLLEAEKPYFGFVSFIGPHPPFAPPIPFNRMYDPDRMPSPVRGDLQTDHMDEQIPHMNYAIWADDINDPHARVLKARYYGEISYIDDCLGRILDAVEARGDADNTLIVFTADHGDHLGDHTAWQKESFFDASCRIPFLLSWPARLPANQRRQELVGLDDLFALATGAAGKTQVRDGIDLLGVLEGKAPAREHLFGYYGVPGGMNFKIMVRSGPWKYIYIANGGREQLFNVEEDAGELKNLCSTRSAVLAELRQAAVAGCRTPGARDALEGDRLRAFPFTPRPKKRIYQFDRSRGVKGFPERPEEAIRDFQF